MFHMDELDEGNRINYTMGMGQANFYAFLLIFPILILLLLPYYLLWGFESFEVYRKIITESLIAIIVIGAIIHELLHGITWALFTKNGFRSIRFGINWKWITPYCHCKEPLKVKFYIIGAAMPLLLMGIIPSAISLVIGNGFLLAIGILFTWAAGGDIISIFMLSRLDRNTQVYDHPKKLGFYIELNPETEVK